jgi:hypothetical protein
MSKLHIKKGDTVYVNSGEDKGDRRKVFKFEACFRENGRMAQLMKNVSN